MPSFFPTLNPPSRPHSTVRSQKDHNNAKALLIIFNPSYKDFVPGTARVYVEDDARLGVTRVYVEYKWYAEESAEYLTLQTSRRNVYGSDLTPFTRKLLQYANNEGWIRWDDGSVARLDMNSHYVETGFPA